MTEIFVFGSNEAGAHGAGAAKEAFLHYGAQIGCGVGLQGNSYGIPTKDAGLRSLPLSVVNSYVIRFLKFATEHPEMNFKVTQIGCGLAGFTAKEIAPMFVLAPNNCYFDNAWEKHLPGKQFWGTF